MDNKSSQKVAKNFFCESCNYLTCKKSNWTKHLGTHKHKMIINDNKSSQKVANTIFQCENCGKIYKFMSGLCRHKKICYNTEQLILVNKTEHLEALTKAQLYEHQKNDINELKTAVSALTTNNKVEQKIINNNNLNISFVLNDYCKEAMNLTQFIDKIKLTLEDLFYTKNNGYIEGMSNIFIKNLKEIEPTLRPIHCLNNKNNELYIKDDNKWAKDDGIKLNIGISAVAKKYLFVLQEWEQNNPNWQNSEKLTEIYMELIQKIIGSSDINEQEKYKNSIKKKISKTVKITDINNINTIKN